MSDALFKQSDDYGDTFIAEAGIGTSVIVAINEFEVVLSAEQAESLGETLAAHVKKSREAA